MKLRVIILLLSITMGILAQERPRLVRNPLTGEEEYITNVYYMQDSLIVLGIPGSNYVAPTGYLNASIGFGFLNFSEHGFNIGWNNNIGCPENFVMGHGLKCDSERSMTIGMNATGGKTMTARIPGSIAFGVIAEYPIMHVHSGYSGSVRYLGDIGGARIGGGQKSTFEANVALEIFGHDSDSAIMINTDADEWKVRKDSMILSGRMETGYLECTYVPKVHSAAGDTSLLPTPLKIGDYYIDTSPRDVYIAVGASRASWKKVN